METRRGRTPERTKRLSQIEKEEQGEGSRASKDNEHAEKRVNRGRRRESQVSASIPVLNLETEGSYLRPSS